MEFSNQVMLITYPDSLGKNLSELHNVLTTHFNDAIGGIHLLPFFPSSGDRGFAPETYSTVDEKFGTWHDIESLSQNFYLMFDLMINHLSRQSAEFQNYLTDGTNSPYADMFIDWDKFWPQGHPTQADIDQIYKRKKRAPYQQVTFADGTSHKVWNTFGDEQIDLNIDSEATIALLNNAMQAFNQHGAAIVRLDAFAYAIKKIHSNDFFVEPEIWNLLKKMSSIAQAHNLTILPEIHEHYSLPKKVSQHNYYTYDFALPMLTLYTLYSNNSKPLLDWLAQSPMKQFTTLDTHDGIGIVDVKDILDDTQIDFTTKQLYQRGSNVKRVYSSAAYHNLDIYQINTTYYSALGENDDAYLLARAIQLFAPGIPQIYYVGLLAGKNDLTYLEETKEGRNINRHPYTIPEIQQAIKHTVVQKLLKMLSFRNHSDAFDLAGSFAYTSTDSAHFTLIRKNQTNSCTATLTVNLINHNFTIHENGQLITI